MASRYPLKIVAPPTAIDNLRDCEQPSALADLTEAGDPTPECRDMDPGYIRAARVVWACSQMRTRIVLRNRADLDALIASAWWWADMARGARPTETPEPQACRGLMMIYRSAAALRDSEDR